VTDTFTAGPWVLISPQPTGATEPGVPKWDRDPEEYEVKAQPAPFMRGFTQTVALVLGKENAHLVASAPLLHEALKQLVVAARTSGGAAGHDAGLCAACAQAEAALAKVNGS
jgi:hypothetical protein